ncbi:MAG: radical SAM protein [Hyphomicrobiales bacterium]|nr:radical SAM protein [Hyphomicrobiales bacterium]
MSTLAVQAASLAKLAPTVLDRPRFSLETAKLLMSRLLLDMRVPADGRGAAIRHVSIRITDRCNLRCHTCGQWGDSGYLLDQPLKELVRGEVPVERYKALVRDLADHGHHPVLYLWGGEPMLYRGAIDLIAEAARLGMPTTIATNGTKIAENAEALVKAPLYLAQLSIDGPTAEIHNSCRPGAGPGTQNFDTVIGALDALREERRRNGTRLPILAGLCTINQLIADHLIDIYDNFANRLDVLVYYLAWWIDEDAAARHTADFARRFGFEPDRHLGWIGGWRPNDFEALSHQLSELSRRAVSRKGPSVLILPHLTSAADLERYYTDHDATFGHDRCTSIYRAVEINANGDMSPCRDYHDYVVGNVKTDSITALWNSAKYRKFRCSLSTEGLMPVCTRCCGLMGN